MVHTRGGGGGVLCACAVHLHRALALWDNTGRACMVLPGSVGCSYPSIFCGFQLKLWRAKIHLLHPTTVSVWAN